MSRLGLDDKKINKWKNPSKFLQRQQKQQTSFPTLNVKNNSCSVYVWVCIYLYRWSSGSRPAATWTWVAPPAGPPAHPGGGGDSGPPRSAGPPAPSHLPTCQLASAFASTNMAEWITSPRIYDTSFPVLQTARCSGYSSSTVVHNFLL